MRLATECPLGFAIFLAPRIPKAGEPAFGEPTEGRVLRPFHNLLKRGESADAKRAGVELTANLRLCLERLRRPLEPANEKSEMRGGAFTKRRLEQLRCFHPSRGRENCRGYFEFAGFCDPGGVITRSEVACRKVARAARRESMRNVDARRRTGGIGKGRLRKTAKRVKAFRRDSLGLASIFIYSLSNPGLARRRFSFQPSIVTSTVLAEVTAPFPPRRLGPSIRSAR